MKKKYLLLSGIACVLLATGCDETTIETVETPDAEVEVFSDSTIASNMESLLKGFTLTGTINQIRYEAIDTNETDDYGDEIYEIDYGSVVESNIYYTTVKYDNADQNKFYKYSYRLVNDVEIAAEGPYTYYEDEEGYAYTAEISYTNELETSYNEGTASGGRKYNFAANGFYNFFTLFNDNDFTLDESRSGNVLTYYNISTSKASIICNNLLYSLNSGAYSTIEEAYIMCRNGVFTQLYIDLTAIQSVDDDTSEVTYIDNTVTFNFSDIGTTTIEDAETYEETTESQALDAVLDTYSDNFTINVTNSYTYTGIYDDNADTTGYYTQDRTYYYDGSAIYIKNSSVDQAYDSENSAWVTTTTTGTDYFLATYGSSNYLYPYTYDSTTSTWVVNENGAYDEEGSSIFALGYTGYYTYEDLLPIISDISGAIFTYDATDDEYDADYDLISDMVTDGCFITNKQPLRIGGYYNASTMHVSFDDSGNLTVTAGYSYYDYFTDGGLYYYGSTTITFSNVGSTSLPL